MAEPENTGTVTQEIGRAPRQRGALSTLYNGGVSSLNALGSVWIFCVMILVNCDAFGRTLFNHPIEGVIEIIEISVVGIVFLQLADATRCGRLTRSDGLLNIALGRVQPVGRIMGALWEFMSILFMGIVLWGSIILLTGSIKNNEYVGADGVFTFPEWPVKAVIVVGCAATFMQFCVFAVRYIRERPNSTQDVADKMHTSQTSEI
jgi:TRAP-type C4-dicarboxylate transport system permease small subunit